MVSFNGSIAMAVSTAVMLLFTVALYTAPSTKPEQMPRAFTPRSFGRQLLFGGNGAGPRAMQCPATVPAGFEMNAESEDFTFNLEKIAALATEGKAKNVILFIADGQDLMTVTASRIFQGQEEGDLMAGVNNRLHFEHFPEVGVVSTWNTGNMVPDSAGTMSAMMGGGRTFMGSININSDATRGDYESGLGKEMKTFLEIAETHGLSTGVVSNTRMTHATIAACYASGSTDRNFEYPDKMPEGSMDAGLWDLTAQFVDFPYGDGVDVLQSGGWRGMVPSEESGAPMDTHVGDWGVRSDGVNLIEEWEKLHADQKAEFVHSKSALMDLDLSETDKLMGLYSYSSMAYNYHLKHPELYGDLDQPSLSEMTQTSIEVLSKNEKGFFLMVEGGQVDWGHHAANLYRAIDEELEFNEAVKIADMMTDDEDTLILVTSDHGHVGALGGYATRDSPILGYTAVSDYLGRPVGIAGYTNGPGAQGKTDAQPEGPKSFALSSSGSGYEDPAMRHAASEELMMSPDYRQESNVGMSSETHGGQDIPIYAKGPGSNLVTGHGAVDQPEVFHIMRCASGLHELDMSMIGESKLGHPMDHRSAANKSVSKSARRSADKKSEDIEDSYHM